MEAVSCSPPSLASEHIVTCRIRLSRAGRKLAKPCCWRRRRAHRASLASGFGAARSPARKTRRASERDFFG